MKKVAGTLRIDLASYRELEAFTKFGSDLDAATQAKLNRGRRTVEVLKQPVHKPLPVEKQVTILYALTHGFLDTVPVDDIVRFEEEFHAFFDAQHPEILEPFVIQKTCQKKQSWMLRLQSFSIKPASNKNRGVRWQYL